MSIRERIERLVADGDGEIILVGEEQRVLVELAMPKRGMLRDAQHIFDCGPVGYTGRSMVLNDFSIVLQSDGDVAEQIFGYMGTEFSRIAVGSDVVGVSPPWRNTSTMDTTAGWRVLANGGCVYDHTGHPVNTAMFKEMLLLLPEGCRFNPIQSRDFCFYCNDSIELGLADYLSRRDGGVGDFSLDYRTGIMRYAYVPIVPDSAIPSGLPGILSQWRVDGGFTWAMLVERRNLIVGWGPEMRLSIQSGKLTISGQVGHQLDRPAAVVVGVNILPEVWL